MATDTTVIVVGQVPPPYGGQAVMIDHMLRGDYPGIRLEHVPLTFSNEMSAIGKFQAKKILLLIGVIGRTIWARLRTRADVLYYPPAGPDRLPIYRDIVILLTTRWMFKRTVFHFHAGGLSQAAPKLSGVVRKLFERAYFRPDLAIRTSLGAPDDPAAIHAKQSVIVHNGVEDMTARMPPDVTTSTTVPRILFVGVLRESKGVRVLVEACALLVEDGLDFAVDLVGEFYSESFRIEIEELARRAGVDLHWHGVLTGDAKARVYSRATIFCFPTHFESESSGIVLLEAMQYSLPIVASEWRGVRDVVADGVNGYLVPPRDPAAVAQRLAELLRDPDLRERLGAQGRKEYEAEYTLERFRERMGDALAIVAGT